MSVHKLLLKDGKAVYFLSSTSFHSSLSELFGSYVKRSNKQDGDEFVGWLAVSTPLHLLSTSDPGLSIQDTFELPEDTFELPEDTFELPDKAFELPDKAFERSDDALELPDDTFELPDDPVEPPA